MQPPIQAAIFGLGITGSKTAAFLLDRGIRIVAAVNATNFLGQDVGIALGRSPIGVVVTSDAEAALSQTRPDIAIVATQNGIEEILPIVKRCLEHGADVITIAGDAYFPSIDSHQAAVQELHALALARGKTILGTGVQDVFWDNLPVLLSGAAQTITGIHGSTCALADEYGDWVLKALQIGASPAAVAKSALHPFSSALIGPLHNIARQLGLSVTDIHQTVEPVVARQDFEPVLAGRTIHAGQVVGLNAITRLITTQGVTLSAGFISKLREVGDSDFVEWRIEGTPNLHVRVEDRHDIDTTSATVVNRIADVIQAPPGFLTVSDLAPSRFSPHTSAITENRT
ncbi:MULTISPECIES: hypothetical protein [Acinetobacter]|uniref:hypothetical protein n=1 Tax=Acinetobacter TaxID=469 RepID=UPI000E6ABBA3|nr:MULTISPECIES: hypothetical protein [Acinetobacter]MDO7332520.1 hypothetical protein [Acinetobacter baumannii]NWK47824.1 hypothetical protein [Acinetobacter sp. SwsAc7]MBN6538815.1 hypothetical protein [Acinetobacter pittii]MDE3321104.1 hypothetical protein [Acinetobacter nosocomialis]MDV7389468.1 hypothetical protein [Acinetobacter baumannii]